jgi:hypothetical protein
MEKVPRLFLGEPLNLMDYLQQPLRIGPCLLKCMGGSKQHIVFKVSSQ